MIWADFRPLRAPIVIGACFALILSVTLLGGCASQPKTDWAGVSTGVGVVLGGQR